MKQAVLNGVAYEDITKVLTAAAPAISEPISDMLKETLLERIPHINFDRESQTDGIVNPNTDLYKQAQYLGYYAEKLGDLDHALDVYEADYNEVIEKIGRPKMYKRAGLITKTLGNL